LLEVVAVAVVVLVMGVLAVAEQVDTLQLLALP
jgi:hypothetical protein